jgi:hypothetical protein
MKKSKVDTKRLIRNKSSSKEDLKSTTSLIKSSPYSITKSRSSSASKTSNNIKNSTSSLFGSTKNLFQESMGLKLTKKQPIKQPNCEIKLESENQEEIEKKFQNEMKNIKNANEEFEVYQKYFEEVIKLDKRFGKFLSMIKIAYETRIVYIENDISSKLKSEIKDYQDKITKEYKEKQLYTKKLEKIAKENVELNRNLDDTENKYSSLLAHIQKMNQFDINKLPKDESTWKSLVIENQNLTDYNKKLNKQIKIISCKEKKLIALVMELRSQGYPVDEVFEKQESYSKTSESNSFSEDTDNEALVSGRAKDVIKPEIIPKLNLDDIKPESSSSDSFYSET